jgi:beta-aspartyl-peptidase (threonine type)
MTITSLRGVALAALLFCVSGGTAVAGSTDDQKAIRVVIDTQVGAWNEGDLDAFMRGYWNDERVSGVSDGAAVKGWKALYEQYKAAYRGEGKEMGKLTFSGVAVDVLGSDAAVVHGKWELTTSKGVAKGHFTQVFKKFPDGWKITHDHSSK